MRHPNLADYSESCLVVVDMQEPFLRTIFDRPRVTDGVQRLIQVARIVDIPILATIQYPEKMGSTAPEIAELLPDVPEISKVTFSCCGEESFIKEVERLGKRTVILCGVETHICINQTAHDLLAAGYKVHVPADAVSSRTANNKQIGLEKMRQSGVIITSIETVVFELLSCAGTDEFRQTLKLIK